MLRLRTFVTNWYREFSQNSDLAISPSAIKNLQATLLEVLSDILVRDNSIQSMMNDGSTIQGRIPDAAREYFDRAGGKPIFLHQLCLELGVSARTLQRAFQRELGISCMKYLKLRRLHLLRERLITSAPEDVSIKQAAIETGAWRPSRYAQDYKMLFGELPSETARA